LTKDKITTTKTRVIAHNQHVVRIDHEDKIPIDNSLSLQIINNIIELHNAHPLDCVIIQDYEKGMMHPGNIKQLVSLINSLGIKIIVDPKDKNFWEYENVFLMKPNRKEAENALGSGIKMNIKDLVSAAQVIEKD
jgi:D-beta-D-heptose 7-phosphate kinase/D-beta-D-heptose 1-phosphate adenosyltransferase